MAERRTVPRYMYGTKGRLHPPGGGAGRNVQIGVISTQGCSILGGETLSIGEKCEIYIDWHGSELGMQAQVANREPDGTLGLHFLSVDPTTQRRLSEVCTSLRIQAPTRQMPEIEHGPLPPVRLAPPVPAAAPPLPRPPVRERRKVPRYVSELRAHITSTTGASTNVRVVTLSILGGCLEGRETPETGARFGLNTDWNGKPLRVTADVVWKNPQGRVGMKFATLDPAAERLVREICSNLRLQPFAPVPPPE